jgi:hypothetical protein
MYEWLGHDKWHLHHGGVVHLPCGVICHDVSRTRRAFDMRIRPNGDHPADYIIKTHSELESLRQSKALADIMTTLKKEKIGFEGPQFMFIPFGRLKDVIVPEDRHASFLNGAPTSIGVVLIGGARISGPESLTRWYKFGNYTAKGLSEKRYKAKDGLIVVSHEERDLYPIDLGECESLKTSADQYLARHSRVASMESDYVAVEYRDFLPQRAQTMLSTSSRGSGRRYSIRDLVMRRS